MRRLHLVTTILFLLTCNLASLLASGSGERGGEAPEIVLPEEEGVSASQLQRTARRELSRVRRGEGGPVDLADAGYVMEDFLRERGYPDALVSFVMYESTDSGQVEVASAREWNRVDRVEFIVRPGRRILVGEITVDGVTVFDEDQIRAFFPGADGEADTPFYRPRFTTAMREVSRLYALEGYADAEVGPFSTTLRQDADKLYYDVRIPIRERGYYEVTGVTVEAADLSEETLSLLESAAGLEGSRYFPRQAATGAIRIRNRLGREGYQAQVDYRAEYLPTTDDVTGVVIHYNVAAGPRLHVRHIAVQSWDQEGLRTRWWFIEPFIPVEEGEVIDFYQLELAEDRLYSLGLFTLVELEAVPVVGESDQDAEADIYVRLTEAESREVQLSAGWGSYELASASATFTDRNIFGIGRSWSTEVYGSFKTRGASTTISDSLLFGPSSTVSLTGSYDFLDAPAYTLTTYEGRLDASFRRSTYWRTEGSYSFGFEQVTDVAEEDEIPVVPEYRAARLTLGLVRDDRNSIVLPTDGTEVGGRVQYSGRAIASELDYVEGALFSNYHEALSGGLTLTLVGTGRARLPLADATTLPIQERLYLGGANSVRSFSYDQLGPVGASGNVIGGLTAVSGTAELRVRLVGAFYLAGFYDLGIVSSETFSLDGTIGQAVGTGLRYYLPIGPVRLDLAYNPGALLTSERRWRLHFAIGFGY